MSTAEIAPMTLFARESTRARNISVAIVGGMNNSTSRSTHAAKSPEFVITQPSDSIFALTVSNTSVGNETDTKLASDRLGNQGSFDPVET